jgi:hypothetical protein
MCGFRRINYSAMTKTPKRPRDPNQLAKFIVDVATGMRLNLVELGD